MVSVADTASSMPCGPDVEPVVAAVKDYADAGFDRLHLGQVGPDQDGFFRFFADELLPALREIGCDVAGKVAAGTR
jgi:hypothetical protein